MKQKITKGFLSIFALMVSIASTAQITDPADPPGGDDPAAAPINNYLILLAIVGIYFAYKSLSKNTVKAK
ncbi:hypothetical protein [uncultured Flavobacterium sp.]|uniref:hypothetical protein n=1 Tax=uncultured Flavobacterium sp. TaxID=165435 RepID=UPI0030C7CDAF